MHCDECREKYELRRVGRSFGLFERGIRERNERRSHEAWERKKVIEESDAAQAHLARFAKLLDAQPSHAATHRLLDDAGFYVNAIGMFRKRWRGGAGWVRGQAPDLEKVLKALKVKDDALLAALKKAGEYDAEADEMVGAPVYTLPKIP